MSQSPSDAGTADSDEAPPQTNHTMETSDKYIVRQVAYIGYYSS